jgi:hypothetical protein
MEYDDDAPIADQLNKTPVKPVPAASSPPPAPKKPADANPKRSRDDDGSDTDTWDRLSDDEEDEKKIVKPRCARRIFPAKSKKPKVYVVNSITNVTRRRGRAKRRENLLFAVEWEGYAKRTFEVLKNFDEGAQYNIKTRLLKPLAAKGYKYREVGQVGEDVPESMKPDFIYDMTMCKLTYPAPAPKSK